MPPATKAEVKREKQRPHVKAKAKKEMQRSQEPSSEQLSVSSLTSRETGSCSRNLLDMMMGEREEAGDKPPTVHQDNIVPPKRSLSPRTHQALRKVVTCILGQVTRKRRGQRDEQMDFQDKLKCELVVLQWHQSGKEACSSQRLQEAGPQRAAPTRPGRRRAGPAQPHVCTEEEGCKLWDSLRKKCQQKTRAKLAHLKAREERAGAVGGPGTAGSEKS
ncbi:uncharacterized protein O9250_012949 [Rhynochetos jubatus]